MYTREKGRKLKEKVKQSKNVYIHKQCKSTLKAEKKAFYAPLEFVCCWHIMFHWIMLLKEITKIVLCIVYKHNLWEVFMKLKI